MNQQVLYFSDHPKGDMSHYLFIFRNMEPLGVKLKKGVCSRLGIMLCLEIQKEKKAMKSSGFHHGVEGKASCMKIFMTANKRCD